MAMSEEKLTQVLDLYEAKATEITTRSEELRMEPEAYVLSYLLIRVAKKIHTMVPQCHTFLLEGRREKLMRWLGFMQGAWWAVKVYTLDELKNHNKPDNEEP